MAVRESSPMKTWVIDADTKMVLSEDLDAEKRTDWLDDKVMVKSRPIGEVFAIYVRDATEEDIRKRMGGEYRRCLKEKKTN